MARGRFVLALAALLLATASPRLARAEEGPAATQRASIFAKGSVVRVLGFWEVTFTVGDEKIKEFVGGMGSGFFASADGFVVTNAHVVEDIKGGEERAKMQAFSSLAAKIQKQYAKELAQMTDEQKVQLVRTLQESAVAVPNSDIVLPDGTKLPYKIVAYGKPGEGSDVAVIKVDIKDAPNLPMADSDKVMIQDRVLAIGYPGAADMQGLLDDKSQLEATINEGAVSAVKRTGAGEPIIQISASITHGNSGGPTINDKGEVIGLSTFGSKGAIQGFNFIVASVTVKKFLAEAKVNLDPSQTTKLWRKGLDDLWSGYLEDALVNFEEVLTLFPVHSEAPRMVKQARALKKEGKGKVRPPPAGSGSSDAAGSAGSADASASGGTGGGGGGGSGAGIAVAVILVLVGVIGAIVVGMKRKTALGGPRPGMHPQHGPPGMHPQQHGMHPPQHGHHPPQHGHHPPHMAPPGAPMMVPGRGPNIPNAPVAKTVAIQSTPSASQPIAATAFGSMTVGVLTCTRGRLMGQRFSLTTQGLLIGRQPGVAQIVLDDPRSSGKHVWIGYEQGQLVAVDQGTTNGTFVNDVRFGRISKAVLKDGDTVIVSEPDCLSLTLKLG
ncbi:MAG: trypsin-like peptidase domain-containing protein [Deltaproteobacteria bacterium]|nr:trypsin-like peptidase domain-containing protein [Deltaproteobacteria bacterium]